jgi:glucose/arabinose dehydrogenase
MGSMRFRTLISATILFAGTGTCLAQPMEDIFTTRVMTGLNQPLHLLSAPGDASRLFVVERDGVVKIYNTATGTVSATPFIDIRDRVHAGQDGGLVGMAFDPDYANNGFVYLQYTFNTNPPADNQLSRFSLLNSNQLNPNSEQKLLFLEQPHTAHNGDWIGFGPDDMLYFSTGDGGDQHDPQNSGQNKNSLLGKVLRIDVASGIDDFPGDPAANYHIPPDNPFVGVDGRDEVFAQGFRNPWKASFDRLTGDLYIGDVGQDSFEEINFISASSNGGENFGWRLREGFGPTPTGGVGGPLPGAVNPVYAYPHGNGPLQGNSVTGGYVYRGPIQSLQGKYFFADFTSNNIWSLEVNPSTGLMVPGSLIHWRNQLVPDQGSLNAIASFGEDALGNLYIVSLSGSIFRIDAEPVQPPTGFTLRVNRNDGTAVLENALGEPISFDGYTIQSVVGSLNPAGFNSFQDQNLDGGTWREIGVLSRNQLGELNPTVDVTLNQSNQRNVGQIFLPQSTPLGVEFEDLVITFNNASTGQTLQGNVVYEGVKRHNNLVVVVDPQSGHAILQNQATVNVTFDGYTITSASGSLLTSWNSLDDQDAGGGEWFEIDSDPTKIGELKRSGATTIAPLTSLDLGVAFNSGGMQDLALKFILSGASTARLGNVSYRAISLDGDFNGDGQVNAADYVVWRKGLGTIFTLTDYNLWRANFGRVVGAASGGASGSSAVPEPASAAFFVVAMLLLNLSRRGGR